MLVVTAALVNTEPARGAVADEARTDTAAEHDHGTVPPAGNVQLFPGEWTLEIKALVSAIDQDVVTDTVPVG
ncbi:MAG: hypothetical protein SGJ13_17185 [Actinomycetota bacterium]|nr:hypothetical protein [Actinomycetota bacterium]